MKEQRDVVVITCGVPVAPTPAAGGPASPSSARSPVSQQTPANVLTPSPSPLGAFSVASTRFSSRLPSVHVWSIVLRFLALVFSFVSALSLAVHWSNSESRDRRRSSSFARYPELRYCVGVAIIAFVYSSLQMFKGVCDISHTGIFISESVIDYLSFILDQVVCYLLISSSSVGVQWIQHMDDEEAMTELRKGSIVSTSMSFLAFFVLAFSCLLSGYKLCKRLIW